MNRIARSVVVTGVTMLTASAVALAPERPIPQPGPEPTVRLIASVQPMQLSPQPPLLANQRRSSEMLLGPSVASVDLPNLLIDWLVRIIVPPSAGAPFPEPEFPPVVGGTSIDSAIKNIYNAIEPWVEWGFDVAAYAVGWVPYVGWLAPQISIFYDFGERIVRSITFNVADWLGGNISFGQGLSNVAVDTINSFIYLANDQLAFWLPPLPPIPPIGPLATEDADGELMRTSLFDESTEVAGTEDLGEEPPQEEFIGEEDELTQGDELTQDEFIGKQEELTRGDELTQDEFIGELDVDLITDGEEQIEEVVADEEDEQIDAGLTVDRQPEETEAEGVDGAEKNTADPGGDPGNATTAK